MTPAEIILVLIGLTAAIGGPLWARRLGRDADRLNRDHPAE